MPLQWGTFSRYNYKVDLQKQTTDILNVGEINNEQPRNSTETMEIM